MNAETAAELLRAAREMRAALDDLLAKKPSMAGWLCGSTTLGNHRAELGGVIQRAEGEMQ